MRRRSLDRPMADPVSPSLPFTGNAAPPEVPQAQRMYILGSDDRPQDSRVVAIAIHVRAEWRVQDREFTWPIALHEFCVMKNFYEGLGGSIRLVPGWAPGVPRYANLTQDDLKNEITRLKLKAVIPRLNAQPTMSFPQFFGADPSEQLARVHKTMKEQLEAWKALLPLLRKRVTNPPADEVMLESLAAELASASELEAIAYMADPSKRGIEDTFLPTVEPVQITVPVAMIDDEADDTDRALARLAAANVPKQAALELATLLESAGSVAKITDAALVKALGGTATKDLIAQVRAALAG